jgi:hypothetical protein
MDSNVLVGKQTLILVLNVVKDQLNKRGTEAIRSIGKMFRMMDSYDRNNKINREEFVIGLRNLGVNLKQTDLEVTSLNPLDNIILFRHRQRRLC